jgi:hypothetical protein
MMVGSAGEQRLSLEITNDRRSERFRDLVSKAFVEILGHDLQYGPWTVMLRSERETLSVVITGPDDAREEWAFDLDRWGTRGPAEMAAQLRQRFRPGNGRSKT